jgi:hypothetical protein
MKKQSKLGGILALGLFITYTLPGCGGGTTGTTGFNSGFSSQMKLSEMTSDEARQLCLRAKGYVDELFTPDNLCNLMAMLFGEVISGSDPAQCQEFVNECKVDAQAQGVEDEVDQLDCNDPATAGTYQACPVSVELYSKCIDEMFGKIQDFVDRFDCYGSDPTLNADINAFFSSETPQTPSCLQLASLCEGFFANNSGT